MHYSLPRLSLLLFCRRRRRRRYIVDFPLFQTNKKPTRLI